MISTKASGVNTIDPSNQSAVIKVTHILAPSLFLSVFLPSLVFCLKSLGIHNQFPAKKKKIRNKKKLEFDARSKYRSSKVWRKQIKWQNIQYIIYGFYIWYGTSNDIFRWHYKGYVCACVLYSYICLKHIEDGIDYQSSSHASSNCCSCCCVTSSFLTTFPVIDDLVAVEIFFGFTTLFPKIDLGLLALF